MSEPDPPDLPQPFDTATSAVRDFAEHLKSVVDTACALVASNRDVDLTGLDREIGLLCAKSLDLPPRRGTPDTSPADRIVRFRGGFVSCFPRA
jgi:hypothetical protein